MAFVFATALVVLGTLLITLYKMFPLNHPQVFFLTTTPRGNLEIKLTELVPTDDNFKAFKERFVREYIRARNEIVANPYAMQQKWGNFDGALVHTWSTPAVYNEFTNRNMWKALMNNVPDFEFNCRVEFMSDNTDVVKYTDNTYAVKFRYFCENSVEKLDEKDYTIIMKLELDAPTVVKWADRLNNPLGIRVSEYIIESGNGDPLDTGYLATGN